MKRIACSLFPVSILLFISSCSTLIYVEKTLDPEIVPEKKPDKIVFVNYFDYTLPEYVKEKNEISYHAGVMKLAEGISASFAGDSSYNFSIADTLRKSIEVGQLTTLLPIDSIRAFCTRYNADMLLALDSLNIFFDWELIADEYDAGNKLKTRNFYLYTRFYLSLYSAPGNLINRSKVERSSFYKSRLAMIGLITFYPSIAKAKGVVENLTLMAGQDYVNKFYPQQVQEQKKIYTGKPFIESNNFIRIKDWNKAIELLNQLGKSSDPKTAEKARHNLLVVKEAAGIMEY
jgi:hypothetical protein